MRAAEQGLDAADSEAVERGCKRGGELWWDEVMQVVLCNKTKNMMTGKKEHAHTHATLHGFGAWLSLA